MILQVFKERKTLGVMKITESLNLHHPAPAATSPSECGSGQGEYHLQKVMKKYNLRERLNFNFLSLT
jgi:hypothetical protein